MGHVPRQSHGLSERCRVVTYRLHTARDDAHKLISSVVRDRDGALMATGVDGTLTHHTPGDEAAVAAAAQPWVDRLKEDEKC